MKTAIVYNPKDNKLQPETYSQVYRSQFLALVRKFEPAHITANCNAIEIDADVIIFYDAHSSHHIQIEGIEKHKAVKYEYFNDPHQVTVKGHYPNGEYVHKLGAKERCQRALSRGVNYIICPFTEPYAKYLSPHLNDNMLVWFPPAPDMGYFSDRMSRLADRKPEVLANGATVETSLTTGYKFRKWAYKQPYVFYLGHTQVGSDKSNIPSGMDYPDFLAKYAASLALTDDHIVPKYMEIPLAGCVCFASEHQDYKNMGFRDGVNCIFVNEYNFEKAIKDFLAHIKDYQGIADRGRQLIEKNWTSTHFANFIFNHAQEAINARQSNAICV